MKVGSIMFGVVITVTSMIGMKIGYEFGRSEVIHQIYSRGWAVDMNPNKDEDSGAKPEEKKES